MAVAGPDIRGIIATCLTPFDPDGQVDYRALEQEVNYIVDACHADAIAIAATEDSEYTMLRWEQRQELMRLGAEMVGRRIPLILGISHPATQRTLELAEHARAVGADMVQVLMPTRLWGGDPDPDELYDYLAEITIHSPLPVSAYHNRGPGADPGIPFYLRIADLFNLPSIVETSGDVTRISRLAEEIDRRGSARYFTTTESLLINLTLGGSGAAMPPPAARVGAEVVRAFRGGDMGRAVECQRILSLFPSRWYRYGLPPVMKAAMRHLGIDLGQPARPYICVSSEDDAEIRRFLEEVGLKEPEEAAPASGPLRPPDPRVAPGHRGRGRRGRRRA